MKVGEAEVARVKQRAVWIWEEGKGVDRKLHKEER